MQRGRQRAPQDTSVRNRGSGGGTDRAAARRLGAGPLSVAGSGGGRLKLTFSSVLPPPYRDELERILFFNPQQGRFIEPLLAAVNSYGVPTIVEEPQRLRLAVPAFRAIQTLFALESAADQTLLAGVAAYVRETDDTMLLLHLAVHQDYTADGVKADGWVAFRLMAAVRDICRRTRGIQVLRVLYPKQARYELARSARPA